MNEKRFFIDKIDHNQYGVYDRLKIGYIKPLVYTDLYIAEKVRDRLNEQEQKIQLLEKENERLRKELKGLNKKYIAFSEATDKRLKEMMKWK